MNIPDIDKLNDADCRVITFTKKWPEFYAYLQERYPGLLFKEQLYLYAHGLDEPPVCPVCGKSLRIYSFRRGYTEFCSGKCQGSSVDVKERRKRAYFEKTGYDNPMHNPAAREKLAQTFIEKYGVENPFQSEEVKHKICEVNRERYGVPYPMQRPDVLEKSTKTIQEKYGVTWNCMRDEACRLTDNSAPNRAFEKLLGEYGIEYIREFAVENFRYDFKVGDTLIEIDPTATHNSTMGIRHKEPLPVSYHKEKTDCAVRNGYRCVHVWDWDDPRKVVQMLTPCKVIPARKCTIRSVSVKDCNIFCNENHIQGTCKGITVALGLYNDDKLVGLMCFGKPRYNKNYQYELLRLCYAHGYTVTGGSEKLFKHFVETCRPQSVISYCDYSKFSGTVYERLGFDMQKHTSPSCHWHNGKEHITDNLLRSRGFDQLFKTQYGKGTSNEWLMEQHGFVRVYDCGQGVYTKHF